MIEVDKIGDVKTTNQLLIERGFSSDHFFVYDRVKDKILEGEETVHDPVILSRISGG